MRVRKCFIAFMFRGLLATCLRTVYKGFIIYDSRGIKDTLNRGFFLKMNYFCVNPVYTSLFYMKYDMVHYTNFYHVTCIYLLIFYSNFHS